MAIVSMLIAVMDQSSRAMNGNLKRFIRRAIFSTIFALRGEIPGMCSRETTSCHGQRRWFHRRTGTCGRS